MQPPSMKQEQKHSHNQTTPDCLWKQAGVVSDKTCTFHFQCNTCEYDIEMRNISNQNKALRKQGKKPVPEHMNIEYWKDVLKRKPMSKRPCIHHMKGNIEFKSCHRSYQCTNCDFDQYFNDRYTVYTVIQPVDFMDIQGISIPAGYYLSQGHTWAKIESDHEVRIGIDDFAMRLLGPFENIQTPLVGKKVTQNRQMIQVQRGHYTAHMISPVNGIVTSVNQNILRRSTLVNESPYTDGWIIRVYSKTLREDLKKLMLMEETKTFLKHEVQDLYRILEENTGLMAADGGSLGDNIFGNAEGIRGPMKTESEPPTLNWESLTHRFLRPL